MSKRRRTPTAAGGLGGLLLLVLVGGYTLLRTNPSLLASLPPPVRTLISSINLPTGLPQPTAAPGQPGVGTNGGSGAGNKQAPQEITFHGCPPQGDGGDPILNQNKNRIDAGNYQPTAFSSILNLQWPPETVRTAHANWSQSAAAQVAQSEGTPVVVEGYIAGARQEGPETPNCHSTTDADFHVWMLDQPGGLADRARAVVVEVTPRVRANHPAWTVNALNVLAQAGTKVRISGWLMLDPEHPEQLQKTRGTLWEIHPIIQIDVQSGSGWVSLDKS